MRVEELIIDGFKSYATRTVISGWDPQFNAITGLNGSGKSNILDAICFVLGITSMTTVRASNLQDLIYKRGQAGVTKASVTIVFDNQDKTKSPIGFESTAKISVTRQIVLGGTSKYLINGHRAQQQTVLQLFQSVQLNINNPNFLIMQGKITKVLNMKPPEILSLIEEAAGTKMFEDRKDKAEKTIAKKETKLQEIRTLLAEEIEPKLEKLRTQKRKFIEFQQIQTDLEKLSRTVNAHDYVLYNKKYLKMKEDHDNREAFLENADSEVQRLTSEIDNLQEDLEVYKKRRETEITNGSKLKDLEIKQTDLSKLITRLNTSRDIALENLTDEQRKKKQLIRQISNYESEIVQRSSSFKSLEIKYNKLKAELEDLQATTSRKEELLSTLTTGVSAKGQAGGYAAQLEEERSKLNETKVAIEQNKLRAEHLLSENKSNEPKLAKAQQDHEIFLQELDNLKQKKSGLEEQLHQLGFNPDKEREIKKREADLNKSSHKLTNDLNFLKRKVANLEFNYSKPSPDFNPASVKGIVAQLFTLSEENMQSATALEVAAGGRLYNVVVDNEVTGSQLLDKGQLRRRVTLIPLNKIATRTMSQQVVHAAKELCPGKVELALNLIGYEHEVTKAMEFIFGSRLICQDADTAKKVTFNPQIRARSVTLQGDVYDPEGTLSGGSRKQSGSVLVNIQQYNQVSSQLNQIHEELRSIHNELNQQAELSHRTKSIQNDLNLTTHQIQLAEKNLKTNNASQLLSKYELNKEEVKQLERNITDKQDLLSKITQEIQKIEKDIKEFSSNKDQKLHELEDEVNSFNKEIKVLESKLDKESDLFQTSEIELEQLTSELEAAKLSIQEKDRTVEELKQQGKQIEHELAENSTKYEEITNQLEIEREKQMGLDEEIKELNNVLKGKNKEINDIRLEAQRLTHEFESLEGQIASLHNHLGKLTQENTWLLDENILNSVIQETPNVNLDECHQRIASLEKVYESMKNKVDPNIMNSIDNVEKKESTLKSMIKTIEKDKSKIEETIVTLNRHKRETLLKTWEKVSADFGQIFGDLLPNAFAKLEAPEGKDITEGLEVKVRLGTVWKESLVELSGGQRSLIALSLILALLQFKPAPMYILDEVDAALDLSHTQNIGHLVKTRFKGSQFIIVSLKEGMFTNANRIFRTRFQDGTSVVSVM